MRKILSVIAWTGIILLNLAVSINVGASFSNIVPSLLAFFNADPSMGVETNSLTESYLTAWADSKL